MSGLASPSVRELGVDGTVRYLHNVMGLWLLQECQRTWAAAGLPADLAELLAGAARVPAFTAVVDVDDPAFLPPGSQPARIAAACTRTGQTPPQRQVEAVRCILDSLALAYRRTVRRAAELSGRDVEVVHVVGGGARNACSASSPPTRAACPSSRARSRRRPGAAARPAAHHPGPAAVPSDRGRRASWCSAEERLPTPS